MIELDPTRQAQLDWQKAKRLLESRLEAYRQARAVAEGIDSVRCAILLAQALDEERTLYEQFEALCLEDAR